LLPWTTNNDRWLLAVVILDYVAAVMVVLNSGDSLGWKFQFLVPISGTPIGSRILIRCSIPEIPIGILFLKFRCLESLKFGISICEIWTSGNLFAQELTTSHCR
jgi:hypothetical protein